MEVSYENQPAGVTNAQGYLLVPGVSAYYPAKYAINTLDLPPEITASRVEQCLTILVILHYCQGQPTEVVSWDGQAWLDNLSDENLIMVQTPDGWCCQARLTLPGGVVYALKTYGPVRCPLNEPASGAPHD